MAITTDTTTLPGQTIITDSNGGVAIDYSSYYSRIAIALETIATRATTLATNSTAITNSLGSDSSNLASMFSSISLDINEIKNLAAGAGVHTQGPQDWIGLISTYKLYVENAGPDRMSLTEFREYFEKVNSLPKAF